MRRMPPISPFAIVSLLALAGCGGGAPGPRAPTVAAASDPAPDATEATGRLTLARSALVPVLDAGLGRFLGRVATEPAREDGAFVGFRVVSIEDALTVPDTEGLGVRPGDVVVRVNGQAIERPEQALAVWEGLRVASTLAIEYLRAGERREARFAIVD